MKKEYRKLTNLRMVLSSTLTTFCWVVEMIDLLYMQVRNTPLSTKVTLQCLHPRVTLVMKPRTTCRHHHWFPKPTRGRFCLTIWKRVSWVWRSERIVGHQT